MIGVIIGSAAICVSIIVSVLFLPEVKIKKLKFAPYWVIALVGAILLVAFKAIDIHTLGQRLSENTPVNPLKILCIFFGMTVMSVFLDEAGFFSHLASLALIKAGKSQKKLFALFYFTVAMLTVFTSNDIIILTFTPFIICFCRSGGIDPKPYLVAQFAAANTFSMMLIIGNPTNIYLAAGIGFFEYALKMFLPALFTGLICFFVVMCLFRKSLNAPIGEAGEVIPLKDKPLAYVALVTLVVSTVLLAVSGYLHFEMWYIALGGASILTLFVLIYGFTVGKKSLVLKGLRRVPWQLAPFLLSMFTMVLSLESAGVTAAIGDFLHVGKADVITFLLASVVGANVLNNIPMSVLFGAVNMGEAGLYAVIIGSNIGALLTPIGALAGIMWTKMLKREGVEFGFKQFVKYGAIVVLCAVPAAALGLYLSFAF